jgi:hypothetical protein
MGPGTGFSPYQDAYEWLRIRLLWWCDANLMILRNPEVKAIWQRDEILFG